MIIANLKKMSEHELGIEYEYLSHRWINETMSCSCMIAVCIDVDPLPEDCEFASRRFTKISNLKALISETINSSDEDVKKRTSEFQSNLEETQSEIVKFISEKRKFYKFPNGTDFNTEYYYIKIKQGSTCKN